MTSAQPDLRRAIHQLDSLPAMPAIAQKLLALKLDTEEGERQMLLLIGQDPLISAKIIGLANTPLFGAAKKIVSVKDAALVLGMTRVQSVATGIAIMSLMKKSSSRFDLQELWTHNLGIAFGMLAITRAMPAALRPDEEQTFLAGMLHDIGYLALAYLAPEQSSALYDRMQREATRPALDIEHELLGVTHAELGAELARHWNLPEEIVAVLRHHHTPGLPEAAPGLPLARIVNLAEKLLPSLGLHEYVDPLIAPTEWDALGIGPEEADAIASSVSERAGQALQFIHHFI